MHRFSLFLITIIFYSDALPAQELRLYSARVFICSYYGGAMSESVNTFRTADEPLDIIGRIVNVIGLRQNFTVRSADVPNAAAVVSRGKRYILYNPAFINAINNASGTDWAGISILAHEIGHHLNGHTITGDGSRPDIELEADEFSGFVLQRLGASLEEAQSAMRVAASLKASHTHPAKRDRLIAIAAGWNNANAQVSGIKPPSMTRRQVETPVAKPPREEQTIVLAEKYIAYDVQFYADPKGKYHVTVRNNLVKIEGDQLYVAGRLALSNRKGYKFMFYDKEYNYLYINSRGTIVNANGKQVGVLKKRT